MRKAEQNVANHNPERQATPVRKNRIAEEQNPDDDARQGGADMQPAYRTRNGSPAKEPCTTIALSGTADEQSAATKINPAAGARTPISAGPVPLYLVPQTISTEIHAHGGEISEIAVKRTGQNVYAISLTKTPKQRHNQGRNQRREQSRNPGGADAD